MQGSQLRGFSSKLRGVIKRNGIIFGLYLEQFLVEMKNRPTLVIVYFFLFSLFFLQLGVTVIIVLLLFQGLSTLMLLL